MPGTHWLALYAPIERRIELFDLFGISPSIYGLDSPDSLHLLSSLQSPSSTVCGHYFIVNIYLCFRYKSQSQIFYLLLTIPTRDLWVSKYIINLKIIFRIFSLCHRTNHCCHLKFQFCLTK